jgi:digeranylgeranylglycerophospholipid reductase
VTNTHDVLIVGGGPSGLHAARLLADHGLRVLVAERKKDIGANVVCTGIVGQEVFSEFDLPLTPVLRELKTVKLVSALGNTFEYHHPAVFASVVDRKLFDQALAHKARLAGAEIATSTRVYDVVPGDGRVRILAKTHDEAPVEYSAAVAILATGVDHRLNERLGLGIPRDYIIGVQAELDVPGDGEASIFVGKSVAPGGFGWSVPCGPGRARVGLLTSGEPRTWFESLVRNFLPELLPSFDRSRIRVKPIVQGVVSKTYGDNLLALGEAAGQVKTTTGGGIYFGLVGARIAADVILKNHPRNTFSKRRLAEYERTWRGVLQKEILIGHYARKVYARFTDRQIERLFDLARTDGLVPLVQKTGRFDWQSGLIVDLARKVPPFSYFEEIRRKLSVLEHYGS